MPIAIGNKPTNIAPAVIRTGRSRVPPAAIAASIALHPVLSRCSRAKVTSKIEFAEATPTLIMAPISDGIENVVWVMNRLAMMPQNASGNAARTTNGSPHVWKLIAISR